MKSYRKVENCGPVPYPDQSGKMLLDGEVVSGDEWEQYVPLGYVVVVESKPKNKGGRPRKVRPEEAVMPSSEPGKDFPAMAGVTSDNSNSNHGATKRGSKSKDTV